MIALYIVHLDIVEIEFYHSHDADNIKTISC